MLRAPGPVSERTPLASGIPETLCNQTHIIMTFSQSPGLQPTLASPSLDEWIEQLHWNVELKRVGEKYCQRHHDLHQDCQTEKQYEITPGRM